MGLTKRVLGEELKTGASEGMSHERVPEPFVEAGMRGQTSEVRRCEGGKVLRMLKVPASRKIRNTHDTFQFLKPTLGIKQSNRISGN